MRPTVIFLFSLSLILAGCNSASSEAGTSFPKVNFVQELDGMKVYGLTDKLVKIGFNHILIEREDKSLAGEFPYSSPYSIYDPAGPARGFMYDGKYIYLFPIRQPSPSDRVRTVLAIDSEDPSTILPIRHSFFRAEKGTRSILLGRDDGFWCHHNGREYQIEDLKQDERKGLISCFVPNESECFFLTYLEEEDLFRKDLCAGGQPQEVPGFGKAFRPYDMIHKSGVGDFVFLERITYTEVEKDGVLWNRRRDVTIRLAKLDFSRHIAGPKVDLKKGGARGNEFLEATDNGLTLVHRNKLLNISDNLELRGCKYLCSDDQLCGYFSIDTGERLPLPDEQCGVGVFWNLEDG